MKERIRKLERGELEKGIMEDCRERKRSKGVERCEDSRGHRREREKGGERLIKRRREMQREGGGRQGEGRERTSNESNRDRQNRREEKRGEEKEERQRGRSE